MAERSDDQSLLTEILISQNCCGQATNRCSLTFPIIHTNQISPIKPLNTLAPFTCCIVLWMLSYQTWSPLFGGSQDYISNNIISIWFQNVKKVDLLWWDNADIFDDSSPCSILAHCIALHCIALHFKLHCIARCITMRMQSKIGICTISDQILTHIHSSTTLKQYLWFPFSISFIL